MATLTQCGKCSEPFHLSQFPEPLATPMTPREIPWYTQLNDKINQLIFGKPEKPSLVFVFPCGHIYYYQWLDSWINEPEKPCPNCNGLIAKDQVGKSYAQLMEIFLTALEKDPEIVREVLQDPTNFNSRCSLSQETFPMVQIRFDGKNLFHEGCSKEPSMKLDDLVRIVKKVVEKHNHIKPWFTPTRLSAYRRFKLAYPLLHKTVVVLSISGSLLALNRYMYNGQNRFLSVLGYPGYLSLLALQYTTLAIAFILNSQEQ
jgi:hypothetical protein